MERVMSATEPQVVVVSVEQYEQYKAQRDEGADWLSGMMEVRELVARELDERKPPPPEEIIRVMREERSEHLANLYRR